MKLTAYSLKLAAILFLSVSLLGCDAFVRKFTRKPKKQSLPREEMVLAPEEYKPTKTKEELYRGYFLYWKSWQDELIEALAGSFGTIGNTYNNKKQLGCIEQALKNILQMRAMLNPKKQKELDVYIAQLNSLRDDVLRDTSGFSLPTNRSTAERLKMRILHDFSYPKVKDSLV